MTHVAPRDRRPIRWRVAEAFEGRWGTKIVLAMGLVVLAGFLVPMLFRPFEGRPAIPDINQRQVLCEGSLSEIARGMPEDASPNDERRVCVERARARTLVASIGGFFVVLFTVIALLAQAGRIQPKEPAR